MAPLLLPSGPVAAMAAAGLILALCHTATAERAAVIIDGVYIGPGVVCPQFLLVSGEQISLEGALPAGLAAGTRLRLEGDFVRISTCMQGRTFRIDSPAPPAPPAP